MSEHSTAAVSSFNIEGEIEMAFFPGQADSFHVRIDGERIETFMARMFGFPNDIEFDTILANELSPDPNIPAVTRKMGQISMHVHQFESDSIL